MNTNNIEKIDYITRQFKRTFGKKYENYCVTRIYHLLNRDDVKFVTQQMFKKKGKDIAFADLYLPQINMWIEVDESHHYKNEEKDEQRTKDVIEENKISSSTKNKYRALDEVVFDMPEKPERITVYDKSLEQINDRIDEIVEIIKSRIKDLGDQFVPWEKVYSDPETFIDKAVISTNDRAIFRIIADIGKLFNMEKVAMGYMIHGCVPIGKNLYFWCPTLKIQGYECDNNSWENDISDDGKYVYENQKDRTESFDIVFTRPETRYIFVKCKIDSKTAYKFIGVFEIDIEESKKKNLRAWRKVSDEINLKPFFS